MLFFHMTHRHHHRVMCCWVFYRRKALSQLTQTRNKTHFKSNICDFVEVAKKYMFYANLCAHARKHLVFNPIHSKSI